MLRAVIFFLSFSILAFAQEGAEIPAQAQAPAPVDIELPEESSRNTTPVNDFVPLPENSAEIPFVDERIFTDPDAVIPQRSPANEEIAEGNADKDRALLVRYREVKVKIEQLPAFVKMRSRADDAKTPEGRRAAMRTYYRAIFEAITEADASLSERCRTMEKAYLSRLAQTYLEPTIPLDIPPSPIKE